MQMSDLIGCYAVIFTNQLGDDQSGYAETADHMIALSASQPGFLGVKSVRDGSDGITVSYWESEQAIADWKADAQHSMARQQGRDQWYREFQLQVCRVERAYDFSADKAQADQAP
jgi:heme-degrading monooxygenase HmoA